MIPEIIIDPPLPLTLSPSLTKEVHCRKGTHSSSPPRKTNELDLTRREGAEVQLPAQGGNSTGFGDALGLGLESLLTHYRLAV